MESQIFIYIIICKVMDSLTCFIFPNTKPQQNFTGTLIRGSSSGTAAKQCTHRQRENILAVEIHVSFGFSKLIQKASEIKGTLKFWLCTIIDPSSEKYDTGVFFS